MVDVVVSRIVHLVVAAIWTGSVVFVAGVLLPRIREGGFDAAPLEAFPPRIAWLSRASALVLVLTGGYLALVEYRVAGYGLGEGNGPALLTTLEGQLVLAMTALWLVLAGLVEVGSSRLSAGFEDRLVREPADRALPFFQGASIVAVLALIAAGLITSGATALVP